ncbi:MAG TPA: peptidase, partial [Rhodanobacter sp.]
MSKQYLKPLALAASLALALAGCSSKQDDSPNVVASSSEASAPTSSAHAVSDAIKEAPLHSQSIFDISELDPNIQACQDFNGFVNAKWVAANPIPSDHTSWGAFNKLADA